MKNNPGKTMTIYDIPKLVKQPLERASTQGNIVAGFKTTGICPFNPDIFKDADFQASTITDRKMPTSTSGITDSITPDQTQLQLEVIALHPKAAPRKPTRKGRKKGKTSILTDTPIRNQIAVEEAEKTAKKLKKRELPVAEEDKQKKLAKKRKLPVAEEAKKKKSPKKRKLPIATERGTNSVAAHAQSTPKVKRSVARGRQLKLD
jgi:hypothetical protein